MRHGISLIGMMPKVMVPFVTVPVTMVANDDLLKVPENYGAFGYGPFRGQSHWQWLQPFLTVTAFSHGCK